MIRSPEALAVFERALDRDTASTLTWARARDTFEGLWAEARRLNPSLGDDWRRDVEGSIAVAGFLNARSVTI